MCIKGVVDAAVIPKVKWKTQYGTPTRDHVSGLLHIGFT